jgi:hypothetical protein
MIQQNLWDQPDQHLPDETNPEDFHLALSEKFGPFLPMAHWLKTSIFLTKIGIASGKLT